MTHKSWAIEYESFLFRKWAINISFIFIITGHLPDSSLFKYKKCFRNGSPQFHALEKILKFRGFRQTLRSFAVIVPNALFLTLTLELAENSLGTIGIKAWKPTCPIFVQLFSDCPTQILGRCFHGYNFLENSENFDFLSLWSEKSRSMFHCPINCPVPCSSPPSRFIRLGQNQDWIMLAQRDMTPVTWSKKYRETRYSLHHVIS